MTHGAPRIWCRTSRGLSKMVILGQVAEWLKEAARKVVIRHKSYRRFESFPCPPLPHDHLTPDYRPLSTVSLAWLEFSWL
jgi:hypothetical protein